MTNKLKLMATASGVVAAVLGATPAFATTTAGNTIDNFATVAYNVGSVVQTAITSNTNTITVDRKVAFTVTEEGSVTTNVAPNQTGAVTTFRITNNSNAVLDFSVAASQGIAAHTGTDNFDTTITGVFVDVNGNGTYESATDTALYADNLAQDGGFVRVFVVATIPSTRVDGDVSGDILQATALEAATLGTQGGALTGVLAATVANTAGMDTVLSDAIGVAAGDVLNDGKHSARDDYTVAAPSLFVTKQSRVISDPVNGALTATNFPKMIPGAVMEYCIVVRNASTTTAASSVTISDTLVSTLGYVASSVREGGTYTGSTPTGTCNLDGTTRAEPVGALVTGNIGTLAASTTRTIYFQATIQ
jgi:hypothetical protein